MDIIQLERLPSLLVSLSEDRSLAPVVKEAWESLVGTEGMSFLAKAAMIYHLSETKAGDGTPLYRFVQLTDAPLSPTWPVFCLDHLGIAPSTASNYKKMWQTYVIDYGAAMGQLSAAGVSKLVAARRLFQVTQDSRLVSALFGDSPLSFGKLLMLLNEIRQERVADSPGESRLRGDVEVDEDSLVLLLTLVCGEDEYYLPPLAVPLDCVPSELSEELVSLLRRKMS